MTDRPLRNLAASVRQRLMNQAQSAGRPFQEVLQYFAMERFLYRLSASSHRERFVLKGALMFTVWGAPASRPTRDIDLLARMDNDVEAVLLVMRDVCQQVVEPDGLVFHWKCLAGLTIKEETDYHGVRVTFEVGLENARVPMQIDIGFGDVVIPAAEWMDYPTLLEFSAPRLRAYPRETVIAEKFEAMVKLGPLNSRMKDFFDLWLLSQRFSFDGVTLSTAISGTFANRQTIVPSQPFALTAAFAHDPIKQTQWKGFLRKSRLDLITPQELPIVIETLGVFLLPLAQALSANQPFSSDWNPSGPWRKS